jgi:hypothetical protein
MRSIPWSLVRTPFCSVIFLVGPLLMLSGCGVSKSNMAGPVPVAGAALGGHVHGGQQPVSRSRVYMFQARPGSYGDPAESRLDGPAVTGNPAGGSTDADGTYVLTDASGDFTIAIGGYTCDQGVPVYLLAEGGNPGVGTGVDNDKLALMAVLGLCPPSGAFSSSEEVIINEATTVAAVYALSGFLTGPTKLSAPNETLAMTGLANATANAGQLVDISTGLARTVTPGGNGVVPQAEIYTLANIIAACVNTDGTNTDVDNAPTACYSVLHGVLNSGTINDTISLMLHVVGSPGPTTVANLIALSTKTSPFQPALTATPNDFTVSIGFSGGGLIDPGIPAVDAEGNVWFPNILGAGGIETNESTLSELSALGVAISPESGTGIAYSTGVPVQAAIDPIGNVWIAFDSGGLVVKYSSVSGAKAIGVGDSGDDVNQIAIDSNGVVYANDSSAASSVSGVYRVQSDGSSVVYLGLTRGSSGVALLSDSDFYTNFSLSGQEYDSSGSIVGSESTCASIRKQCGMYDPTAFAVDSSGNVWAPNTNNTLAEFSMTGSQGEPNSPFSGGVLSNFTPPSLPVVWLAIDGDNNVWVPNYYVSSVSEFSHSGTALTPSTGFMGGQPPCEPNGLAIDGSGDVWVSCESRSTPVVEFIGAAVPVYTPLTPGHFGVRP